MAGLRLGEGWEKYPAGATWVSLQKCPKAFYRLTYCHHALFWTPWCPGSSQALPQMDDPQPGGESSLELPAAQPVLQQPSIDHLVQLLSPLGEKGGRQSLSLCGDSCTGAFPFPLHPLLLSTAKIRLWIVQVFFQFLIPSVPSAVLETELYLQGWVILGLGMRTQQVPVT